MKRTTVVISVLLVILTSVVVIAFLWQPTRSASQGPAATQVAAVYTPSPTSTTTPTLIPTGTRVVNPSPTRVGLAGGYGTPTANPPTEVPTLANTKAPASKTPVATEQATTVQATCRLDKVNTINVPADEKPQRIEIGGHGPQGVDYYPLVSVPAVTYLVSQIEDPSGVPDIWWGFGGIWEAPLSPECSDFDWLADAVHYATARLDSGHSGLVIDLRGGSPKVVANVNGLSKAEITDLLALHLLGQTSSQAAAAACEPVRDDRAPVVGEPWETNPSGGWILVNLWSNQPGVDQQEYKLLLGPAENPLLLGGGARWTWTSDCESVAKAEFESNPLPEVTLAELDSMGLVPND